MKLAKIIKKFPFIREIEGSQAKSSYGYEVIEKDPVKFIQIGSHKVIFEEEKDIKDLMLKLKALRDDFPKLLK